MGSNNKMSRSVDEMIADEEKRILRKYDQFSGFQCRNCSKKFLALTLPFLCCFYIYKEAKPSFVLRAKSTRVQQGLSFLLIAGFSLYYWRNS